MSKVGAGVGAGLCNNVRDTAKKLVKWERHSNLIQAITGSTRNYTHVE